MPHGSQFRLYADAVKARVGVMWALKNCGVEVGRHRRFRCISPAHDDKDPSAVVNKDDQGWICYSCGARGSVIDVVMEAQGHNYKSAVETLGRMCGIGTYREFAGLDRAETTRARYVNIDLDAMDRETRAWFTRLARSTFGGNRDKAAQWCVEQVVMKYMERGAA